MVMNIAIGNGEHDWSITKTADTASSICDHALLGAGPGDEAKQHE